MKKNFKSVRTYCVPTEKSCMECYGNLFSKWSLILLENPLMTDEEMVAYLSNQKHEMDKVRALNSMDFIGLIDTKLTHSIKCMDEKHTNEKIIPTILPVDVISSELNVAKISVSGNKGDFGVKAGWFFFNPDNPQGLRLSKTHTEAIIFLLRERFSAFDGSLFSRRYMVDKIAEGRNNEPNDDDD